jgi:hypothetical protein
VRLNPNLAVLAGDQVFSSACKSICKKGGVSATDIVTPNINTLFIKYMPNKRIANKTANIQPVFIQRYVENQAEVRAELQQGLMATAATTSPKYLYDALGSRLFEAITELPEYYPTRVETSIFQQFSHEMAEAAGLGHALIDLGAGNCEKAARMFEALQPANT